MYTFCAWARRVSLLLVTWIAGNCALAQSPHTANTWQLEDGQSAAAADLDDFSWLQGHWAGPGLGGDCEEWWMAPAGGSMLGMFRAVRGDKLVFSEFFSLHEKDGGVVLRLRHFAPDFIGWEEKDHPVDFPLISVESGLARFAGLTYRLAGEDELHAIVAIKNAAGEFDELKFEFRRVNP